MSNKYQWWGQAEDLIKKYNLKPKDWKGSSNWNKKSDLKDLEKKLKAGAKKGSDDATFKNDAGQIVAKSEQNNNQWAAGSKAGDPGGTGKYGSWLDMGVGGGWFGTDDLAQVRKWAGSPNLKTWLDRGDHRGLGKVEAIGRGVAADLWGYTDPGDKDAFGRKDMEELQRAGATDSHIRKIREGFSRRGAAVGQWARDWSGAPAAQLQQDPVKDEPKPEPQAEPEPEPTPSWATQESTGVDPNASPDVDLSIGPYTQQAHKAGKAAMGVKTRRSQQSKELAALGTKQLSRAYRNLSINV